MRRPVPVLRLLLAAYVVLLAVSHVVRVLERTERPLPRGDRVLALRAVAGERLLDARVAVAYRDYESGGQEPALPVLLLHGSPGSKRDFASVAPRLAAARRVIAPDLPGFGASGTAVPDYSIRAHARYMVQLLDALDLRRVHVLGFSMGGGVGLELYDLAPERVASLTLLSAIGVQELELFGDHRLNRLVHGAQLAAIRGAQELLPHMGLLDGVFFGRAYARNFYDSDQRPLRAILSRLEPPVLILHGADDFLVPPEAAREHHRIVPHSELQLMAHGHFVVFRHGEEVAGRIAGFLERVDVGAAPRRADSEPRRLTAARAPFDPSVVPPYSGVALVLVMALIAVATLASEDLTCIGVGLMIGQGRIDFLPGTIACFAGIFVGDMLLFLTGRLLGRPALERAPLRWLIRPELVEISSAWFTRRGPVVIGLSRFFPGTRLPTYFAAGLLRTRVASFSLYFFVAVAVWTPLLVAFSMLMGERAFGYFEWFQRHALVAFVLLGLWILVVVKWLVPLLSFRGRRRLVGRWRRALHWEFWPPWLFYPPVLGHVLLLGLRHRSPLLFTAANPGIEAGGFIAESKGRILEDMSGAAERVARTRRIPGAEPTGRRVSLVRRFMDDGGLDYPVVLKPDAGQRGSGVIIARQAAQVESYMASAPFDVLVQEYVPGVEFGVFYYRLPREARGRIFSITEKRTPVVTGDGKHTVEQLILQDDRAVCMADHYLSRQAHQLERVPANGESIPLVELGTHCRGAIFLDGWWVHSGALERAVDEISRSFRGFYFGRYDLRVSDGASLKRGEGFKVIELNGVTSEATHIYDPKTGLLHAYGVLFEQWSLAFEIGRRNRERGVRPSRPAELLRLLATYRRISRAHPG